MTNESDSMIAAARLQGELWSGVTPQTEVAARQAEQIHHIWKNYLGLRAGLGFEDEPSNFEAALLSCREGAAFDD